MMHKATASMWSGSSIVTSWETITPHYNIAGANHRQRRRRTGIVLQETDETMRSSPPVIVAPSQLMFYRGSSFDLVSS
jgi:hypothetical protein